MYHRHGELVGAATQRLSFWGLRPDHRMVILSTTYRFKPTVDAFYAAAMSLGAEPTLLVIPDRKPFQDVPPFAEAALCEADFVIDLQHLNWAYTRSHGNVVVTLSEKGAFYTVSGGLEEDVETLISNQLTEGQVRLARAAQQLIDDAKTIRVTTKLGTDLRVERGDPKQYPAFLSELYGQVAFAPPVGTSEGQVAFTGVVRLQAPEVETFAVYQPIMMEIEQGRITSIDRSTAEGARLDDWYRSFGRSEAYEHAHINLGLVPLSLKNIDNEAIHFSLGGILLGFGIRDYYGAAFKQPGGEVFPVPEGEFPNFHADMHLVNVTYYADDLPLVRDGGFTEESGLAAMADDA